MDGSAASSSDGGLARQNRGSSRLAFWSPSERKTIYLFAIWLFAALCFAIVYVWSSWREFRTLAPGQHAVFGDFLSLWSYGQVLAEHHGAQLYDWDALRTRQIELGMKPTGSAPFPYPPPFMLFFRPLAILPLAWSYVAWSLTTLLLFATAVAASVSPAPWSMLAVLVGPTTIISIACGQTGFVAAALMTAGLRLFRSRPILGGIAFGLLVYKPQLGLLVPVALLATGAWRAAGAAIATVCGLSAVVTAYFGVGIWSAWLSTMPRYQAFFDQLAKTLPIQPTVTGNLHLLGFSDTVTDAAQVLVALLVVRLIWRCYRRSPSGIADAALIVGTFLATPHALVYDLPMLTAALCLFVQDRVETGGRFNGVEVLLILIATIFPAYMMVVKPVIPISSVCLALLLVVIVRQPRAAERLGSSDDVILETPAH